MRPSLTTLAGMTFAAGTLALGGVAATTASATERLPVEAVEIVETVEAVEVDYRVGLFPNEDREAAFGSDAEDRFASPVAPSTDLFQETPDWIDDCPPCGMG